MRETEHLTPVRAHGLTLEGRKKAVINGVEGVDSFNEQLVVLSTSLGTLTMMGDGLHVSHLNLEEGQLLVEGEISALEYDDRIKSGRGSFFSRLMR